jgi:hypothetical protein
LLTTPDTVTSMLPVVAPLGTVAEILVSLQLAVAGSPLKDTVFVPWLLPKLDPEMVTAVPAGPTVGDTLAMTGPDETVKGTPLLLKLETMTATFPVVAPGGTVAIMPVAVQLDTVADVPSNVTVLVPCVAPKPVPAITTGLPTLPDEGARLEIASCKALRVIVADPQTEPTHAVIVGEPAAKAYA